MTISTCGRSDTHATYVACHAMHSPLIAVAYVCMRPREEFSSEEEAALERCLETNVGTNHWATKVMSVPGGFRGKHSLSNYAAKMQNLMQNPIEVYDVLARGC